MFRVAQAKAFRLGYEKTPFHEYRALVAAYEAQFGRGEANPFHRCDFDTAEGEDKLLLYAVATARVFYEFLGHSPRRFDELVALLQRAYFPQHLALAAAARALKEFHY
jgi:hypothetical protein